MFPDEDVCICIMNIHFFHIASTVPHFPLFRMTVCWPEWGSMVQFEFNSDGARGKCFFLQVCQLFFGL